MADFSAPAPVEPVKTGEYLHDRSRIPPRPRPSARAVIQRYPGYALGIALALGAMALMFQTRASWERHREWVVPTTAPLTVVGGIALGYLLARRRFMAAAPALGCLAVVLLFTAFNAWRGAVVDGPDAGRDAMSIFAGVFMGLFVATATVAMVVVEVRNPTRPLEPAV